MDAAKTVRVTSVIMFIVGLFLLFVMFVAGRGIIFILPSGWIMLALVVFTIINFAQAGRFVRQSNNAGVMMGISIVILILSILVFSWLILVVAVCAVVEMVAIHKWKMTNTR